MAEQTLPRREREKLRQRQEIVATALDLFSRKGYHNVSMHEIAEKAEFAIGTLYKFFQNKEDLYKTLVLERCDDFAAGLCRAMEQSDDEVEKLRHYVRFRSDRFRNNLPFVRLFLAESRGIGFNLKAGLDDEVRKRYYDILERLALVFRQRHRQEALQENRRPLLPGGGFGQRPGRLAPALARRPRAPPLSRRPGCPAGHFFQGLDRAVRLRAGTRA